MTTQAESLRRPPSVTWNVDDVPWTPLTGLFINKSGYKPIVDMAYTGNAYSIELTKVGPGGMSPTHVEPHAHLFYVLAGHGEVTVGEEVKEIRPGSVSPISAGVPHSFRNLGNSSLEMLVVYHPPRVRNKSEKTTLSVRVQSIRYEAEGVLSLELAPLFGTQLPVFDAGSHIDLHLPHGLIRSYSLCSRGNETGSYVVAVSHVTNSRGGSRFIHEQLKVGTELEISNPRNNFPLREDAEHSVLIAGGIGITPILNMLQRLTSLGRSVELLYCARSRKEAAFIEQIEASGAQVHWHFADEQAGLADLNHFITSRNPGAHYYACGPASMLDDFERICRESGREHAHTERFVSAAEAAMSDVSYRVELARSGRELEVKPGTSLLRTLLDAGVEVPYSCQQGVCGACKTQVIQGEPDHRDSVLTPVERSSNSVMTVCVSGCRGENLVLDL